MPRGFSYGGESREGVTDREAVQQDLRRKRRFQPIPDTLTASSRRTIEAAQRAKRSSSATSGTRTPPPSPPPIPERTVVPGATPPPEDKMTFINVGGSGPTFPSGGGFEPNPFTGAGGGFGGGGGGSIGDRIRGGLGGLIDRGLDELGDAIFGGGGSEAPGSGQVVPGAGFTGPTGGASGPCPGAGSIRVAGKCINLGDLAPGGHPAITPQVGGDWNPVLGLYGAGVTPMAEERVVRKCPAGFVLGKDGVCYDGLAKSKRKWNPGRKPLLTGGEMAAIAKAKRAAGRIKRAQKGLKKAGRALEKVG